MGGGALCVLGGASHRGGAGGGLTAAPSASGSAALAVLRCICPSRGSTGRGSQACLGRPSWNLHVWFFWVVEWG